MHRSIEDRDHVCPNLNEILYDLEIGNERDNVIMKGFDSEVHWNPETKSKTVNVYLPGTGPICRLDVDGTHHGDVGRSHKHSLQTERCPDRNLSDSVVGHAELAGRPIKEVFETFCEMATIEFTGSFDSPEGVES